MKIFVDSADISEIKRLNNLGFVDGVTTNPSLVNDSGKNYRELLEEICVEVKGPVSAEVSSHSYEDMRYEGRDLSEIADNIVVKLPLTKDGLRACRQLVNEGCKTNVTLCFSAVQALLAAKCGATFISPFVGRLDDVSVSGMDLISDVCTIFRNYRDINTKIIVASVRSPMHVLEAAKIGADIATLPPKILDLLITHPLTDKGMLIFDSAWKDYYKKS